MNNLLESLFNIDETCGISNVSLTSVNPALIFSDDSFHNTSMCNFDLLAPVFNLSEFYVRVVGLNVRANISVVVSDIDCGTQETWEQVLEDCVSDHHHHHHHHMIPWFVVWVVLVCFFQLYVIVRLHLV